MTLLAGQLFVESLQVLSSFLVSLLSFCLGRWPLALDGHGLHRSPEVVAGQVFSGLPLGARPGPTGEAQSQVVGAKMVWQRSGPKEPNDLSGEAA
jgi:hypothetical protein